MKNYRVIFFYFRAGGILCLFIAFFGDFDLAFSRFLCFSVGRPSFLCWHAEHNQIAESNESILVLKFGFNIRERFPEYDM